MIYRYATFIYDWKAGKVNGSIGIRTGGISSHIKRYLREKSNGRCPLCGWDKVHPILGRPPLEIDHIDGNSENNAENNLRLICPNCHALSPNFKALNRGKGRKWRMDKYIKNQSQD